MWSVSWGNCLKYLKKGGSEQKRGEGKQRFNKWGRRASCVKGWVPKKWGEDAGTPLKTMVTTFSIR